MQEIRVRSLCREDPLEKEMATHSSILTWKIPWMEEPGRLQSMGWQKVRQNLATKQQRTTTNLYLQSCPPGSRNHGPWYKQKAVWILKDKFSNLSQPTFPVVLLVSYFVSRNEYLSKYQVLDTTPIPSFLFLNSSSRFIISPMQLLKFMSTALNICISKDTQLKIANASDSTGFINKDRILSNQTKCPEVVSSRTSPFSSQQCPYRSRFLHSSIFQYSPYVFASVLWLTDSN